MLSRYIWLVATVSNNIDHFHVAESSIGMHCSKAFEFCPGVVVCREVDELMLMSELASPSCPHEWSNGIWCWNWCWNSWQSCTSSVGNSLDFLSLFCLQCWRAGWTILGNWSPHNPWPGFHSSSIALNSCWRTWARCSRSRSAVQHETGHPRTNGDTIQGCLQEELCIF